MIPAGIIYEVVAVKMNNMQQRRNVNACYGMKCLQSKKLIFTCCLIEKVIYYVSLIQPLCTKAYNSCTLAEVTQAAFCSTRQIT